MSTQSRFLHEASKVILRQAAERMPAEEYGFRPVNTVRTFGQIVGHIADMHYIHCSVLSGDKTPRSSVEQSQTTKPGLVAALKDALTYCDAIFRSMSDSAGARTVQFNGAPIPRLSLLGVHHMHNMLHYGNLTTYLRIKGIVPPTSDPAVMAALMAQPGK